MSLLACGPKSYEDCVLAHLDNGMTAPAVLAVREACRQKFPEDEVKPPILGLEQDDFDLQNGIEQLRVSLSFCGDRIIGGAGFACYFEVFNGTPVPVYTFDVEFLDVETKERLRTRARDPLGLGGLEPYGASTFEAVLPEPIESEPEFKVIGINERLAIESADVGR